MLLLAGRVLRRLTPSRSLSSSSLDSSLLAHCGVSVPLRLRVSTRDTETDLRAGSRAAACERGVDWYRFDGGPDALRLRVPLPGRVCGDGEGFAVGAGAFFTRTVLVLILGLPGANMTAGSAS